MPHPEIELSRTLEQLVGRFQGLLRAVAHRYGLTGADADELAQEVRIRLWRALREHEKIAAASASYVKRTALSAAVDLIRRRRARHEESLEGALELATDARLSVSPHEQAERSRELEAGLEAALEALAHPRDVVVRLYLLGYDRQEIAELMDWTEAKVRNLLYRGLDDLRTELRAGGLAPREIA